MWHTEEEVFPFKCSPSSVNSRDICNPDKLCRSSVIPFGASLFPKCIYITCPPTEVEPYLFQTYPSSSLFIISIVGWTFLPLSQINISILPGIEGHLIPCNIRSLNPLWFPPIPAMSGHWTWVICCYWPLPAFLTIYIFGDITCLYKSQDTLHDRLLPRRKFTSSISTPR